MPVSPKVRYLAGHRAEMILTGDVVRLADGRMHVVDGDRVICCDTQRRKDGTLVGAEVAIRMELPGGVDRRAEAARRMLAERQARRDAGLVGPVPTETPREKVRRLARERRARNRGN